MATKPPNGPNFLHYVLNIPANPKINTAQLIAPVMSTRPKSNPQLNFSPLEMKQIDGGDYFTFDFWPTRDDRPITTEEFSKLQDVARRHANALVARTNAEVAPFVEYVVVGIGASSSTIYRR